MSADAGAHVRDQRQCGIGLTNPSAPPHRARCGSADRLVLRADTDEEEEEEEGGGAIGPAGAAVTPRWLTPGGEDPEPTTGPGELVLTEVGLFAHIRRHGAPAMALPVIAKSASDPDYRLRRQPGLASRIGRR
jgi:hypothetical protein